MDDSKENTGGAPRRRTEGVVELEIRLPRWREMPPFRGRLGPVGRAARRVAYTGLGLGVLAAREIARGLRRANEAGRRLATDLGRRTSGRSPTEPLVRRPPEDVSGLPIDDYDALSAPEVVERLTGLGVAELRSLRGYEAAHANRASVIEAIDRRLDALGHAEP